MEQKIIPSHGIRMDIVLYILFLKFLYRNISVFGRYLSSVYIVHYCVLINFSAYLFMKPDFTYNVSFAITCLCTIFAVVVVAYIVEKSLNYYINI